MWYTDKNIVQHYGQYNEKYLTLLGIKYKI